MNSTVLHTTERITDAQRDSAIRLAQVTQRFATMFVGRKVGVRLSDKTFAPAWSTHNTIEFAEATLPDLSTIEGILSVKGLTFHELSHILFTPRTQSDIVRFVQAEGLGKAFNALEDQRIETLMVAQYQALQPWLTATVAQYLLDNPSTIDRAFPLIRGRKYLPVQIRKMVKDAYAVPADVAELSTIIDTYRTLLFPQDTEQAKPLIARYAELVKNLPEAGQGEGEGEFDPNGHETRPCDLHQSTVNDKPASKREQERARDKAKAQDAEVEDEDEFQWGDEPEQDEPETEDESASNNQPADSTDSDDSDSDSADGDDADGSADGDDSEGESDDGDGQSDSDASDSPADSQPQTDSTESASGIGDQPDGIKSDVLNDILDSIKESLGEAIANDIAQLSGDVVLEGVAVPAPRLANSTPALPSDAGVTASVAFRTELERIKAQYDPSWEFKTRKGRLNPVRYSQGYDISEVFDKFEYGRDDAVDIEAVILLDTSGSMAQASTLAFESMWGIKRALDGVGASCTVITFDYNSETLYGADEPASTVMKTTSVGGSTNPIDGLQYANYVLAQSERKTKVLFNITDGAWANAERANNIIQNLRDGGVLTSLAYIETSGHATNIEHVDAHNCEAIAHVTNPADLLNVGKAVVNLAIARNLVQA